jgi:two-component system cell cycle response regulator
VNSLPDAKQQTILIVDDEPQNIHLLGQTLKDEYHILVATSGQQALDKMAAKPYPDLILLDVLMPDINGFDICKKIKNTPATRDIPIIFVTAKDSAADEKEGLEIGAVDFIAKPFNNAIVLARVKAHLSLQNQKSQIKHNEALLKATLEATKDGIAVFNTKGQLLLLNQNFIDMWHFPESVLKSQDKEQFLAYGLSQLVDGDTRRPRIDLLWQSDNTESDLLKLKDGRIFSRYSEPLIQDDKKVGRVVSYTDISEQKKLETQLRELSLTDPLTGLYNRRKLNEILHDEFDRAKRYEHQIAVLMIDIDHFKAFNDSYGHDQGDRILKNMAHSMKKHFRNVDWCCRFGGEEFSVIMPDSELPGALDAAERFRCLIAEMNCDGLHITISIDVSILSHLNEDDLPEELISLADKALYSAKAQGRNQVQVYR